MVVRLPKQLIYLGWEELRFPYPLKSSMIFATNTHRIAIVISNYIGKLFLHQTRVIARNTCLNLNFFYEVLP